MGGSQRGRATGVRVEHDSLGPVEVPVDALYGAQTARASVARNPSAAGSR